MKLPFTKYSRLIRAILITIAAIFIIGLLTHFISSWSADVSSEEEIRIQNLLTMQKDSLESVYLQEKINALDSVEISKKQSLAEKDKHITSLKKDLKTEKNKNED